MTATEAFELEAVENALQRARGALNTYIRMKGIVNPEQTLIEVEEAILTLQDMKGE